MILEANKISKWSLLYLLFAGIGLGSLLVYLLFGILAAFEVGSITIESELKLGADGFIGTMMNWPIFAIAWTLITWLMITVGLWLLGKFWSLKLVIADSAEQESAGSDSASD